MGDVNLGDLPARARRPREHFHERSGTSNTVHGVSDHLSSAPKHCRAADAVINMTWEPLLRQQYCARGWPRER
eukprot:6901638-Pyramimonas_sp.AAC.1